MASSPNNSRTSKTTLNHNLNLTVTLLMILFATSPSFSRADDANTFGGSLCSIPQPENNNPMWTSTLNALFVSLETNVNPNNGFYTAQSNNSEETIYGLLQCRSDLPSSDCLSCARNSFALASENCQGSKTVTIWQRWCTLRYSNVSFFGSWGKSGASRSVNATISADRTIGSKGSQMMSGLVSSAPLNQTTRFGESEIDVGDGMMRYGAVQCTRDLARKECGDCLNYLLTDLAKDYVNQTAWEAYGLGCAMWYDDYQFYFMANSTGSVSHGPSLAPSPSPHHAPQVQGFGTPPSPHNSASSLWAGKMVLFGVVTLLATAKIFESL